MSILPNTLPQIKGYDFGALMEPARAVGGDFYDIFQIDKNRIGIVIGDVTDKGVPSAIFMAQAHALIYAEAMRCKTPLLVLQRVNNYLRNMGASHLFVTVIYGVLHLRERRIQYARAGHELPIYHHGKSERPVTWNPGQPLGLMANPAFDEQEMHLEKIQVFSFIPMALPIVETLKENFMASNVYTNSSMPDTNYPPKKYAICFGNPSTPLMKAQPKTTMSPF
ncbi:MAG: SpoIIE family protein phosphatase [Anaerolineae bacterium]|nr:SpoIIE family protein phosphatase [Anaerolineae bacterium]